MKSSSLFSLSFEGSCTGNRLLLISQIVGIRRVARILFVRGAEASNSWLHLQTVSDSTDTGRYLRLTI